MPNKLTDKQINILQAIDKIQEELDKCVELLLAGKVKNDAWNNANEVNSRKQGIIGNLIFWRNEIYLDAEDGEKSSTADEWFRMMGNYFHFFNDYYKEESKELIQSMEYFKEEVIEYWKDKSNAVL